MSGVGFFFNLMTEYSIINSGFHGVCAKVKEMNNRFKKERLP